MKEGEVIVTLIEDDGTFPNNGKLPVLVYKKAVQFSSGDPASKFESLYRENGWGGNWRNGIYGFHHYHSTAHEVLGVSRGKATVQLGGENGPRFDIEAGDVIVLPAGVAHKKLSQSSDFEVVGGYPKGQDWDMNYGKEDERPKADRNIEKVPLPSLDPISGKNGGLMERWFARR